MTAPVDISREAVEHQVAGLRFRHKSECRSLGLPSKECTSAFTVAADMILALRAAIDRADADKAAAVDAEKERCAEIAESIDAVAFRARYEVTYTKKRFDQYSHEKGVNQALNIQAEDAAAAIRAGAKP